MTNPTPTATEIDRAYNRLASADRILHTVKIDRRSTPRDVAAAAVNVATARARVRRLVKVRNAALLGR